MVAWPYARPGTEIVGVMVGAPWRTVEPLVWALRPMYLEVVSGLETIVEDLKSLTPGKLEAAADFRRLKPISQEERETILARTFGSLPQEDADAMLKAIEEGCEIDERGW